MIKIVECLAVECDTCGQPLDDFTDEGSDLIHFGSMHEVVCHLGGVYEGQIFEGSGRSGGVLLNNGVFYCYSCKLAPHEHVPGRVIGSICERCGELNDQHPTGPATAVDVPLPERAPQRRRVALSPRVSWCTSFCAESHSFEVTGLPEPADLTRIEFTHFTDRYAAWHDVESAVLAGHAAQMSWTLYPASTGHTWECLQQMFGPSLDAAILLAPAGVLRPAGPSTGGARR